MDKYLLPDGTELSQEELESRANEQGVSLSELISSLGAVNSTSFTPNDTQQFFLDKGAALVSTVANIGKGIPDFAEAIVDAGVQTYMDISDQFTDIDYTQDQRDRASRVIEQSMRFDEDFEQLANLADSYRTKYDKDMLDSFKEGDYAAGADQLISGVISAIPSLLVSAAPGGLIALGMSEAGASYEELSNESPEKRGSIMLANSILQGVVEAKSEQFMLGAAGKISKFVGKTNAVKGIVSKVALNAFGEAFTETAAQEINYGLDSFIGDNRFTDAEGNIDVSNILKRTIETGLISGIVGGGKGAIDQVSSSRRKKLYNEVLTPFKVHERNNKISEEIIKKRSINTSLKNPEVSNEIELLESQLRKNKKIADDVLSTYSNSEKIENIKLTGEITELLAQKKNNVLDQPAIEELDALIVKKVTKREAFFQSKLDDLTEKQVEKTLVFAEDFKFKLGDELNTKLEVIDEETAQENQKKFEESVNSLKISEDKKKEAIDNFNKIGGFASGNTIVINKSVAENLGQINVGAHEVLHNIFDSVVKTKSKKEEIINGFKERFGQKNTKIVDAEIKNNYLKEGQSFEEFKKTEQYFDEFLPITSDLLTDEVIKFEEPPFERLKGFIEGVFRPFGYKKLNFKNPKGVYDFMKSYQKSVIKGKTTKEIQDFVKREKITESDIDKINFSKDIESKIDDFIGKRDSKGDYVGVTKEQYDSVINKNNAVVGKFYTEIASLIKKSIPDKYRRLPNFSEEDYIQDTLIGPEKKGKVGEEDKISGLMSHINNFNPERKLEGRTGLSGWIKSQISNKGKTALKSEKVTSKTFNQPIGEDFDIADDASEVGSDIDIVKKESPTKKGVLLRESLGIEEGTGLYEKILDSVTEDFQNNFLNYFNQKTNVINPQVWEKLRNKFKKEFTLDIRSNIFKGEKPGSKKGRQNLINFLKSKENIKIIFEKLDVKELVALESKVSEENRIFTDKIKKNLSPKKTQKLRDEGVLRAKTDTQSPDLFAKKQTPPTPSQVLGFFTSKDVNKKTRSDRFNISLVESLSSALALDAYTKVLTSSNLSKFSGEEKYNAAVTQIFNEIKRDSNTINFKQSGQKTFTIGIDGLKNINLNKFRKEFDKIGNAVKNIDPTNKDQTQSAIDKINSFQVSQVVKDIAIKFYENKFLREKFNWGGPLEEVRLVKVINGQNNNFIKAKEHNAFFNKNEPDIVLVVKSKETKEEKEINLEAKQGLTSLLGSEGIQSEYNYKTNKWSTKLELNNENNTFLEKSLNEESSEIEIIVDQFYDFAEDFISKDESLKEKYKEEFGIEINLSKPASKKTRIKRSIPMKVPQEVIEAFDNLIPPRKTSIKNAKYTDINGDKKTISRLTKTENNIGLDKITSHYTSNKGDKLSSHIITFSGVGFSIGLDNSLNLKNLSEVTYKHKGVDKYIELNRRLKRDKSEPTKSGFVTVRLRSINEFDGITKQSKNAEQILKKGTDFSDVKAIEEKINFKTSKENIDPFKNLSDQFNIILQENKQVDATKIYTARSAAREGAKKGKYKFFVPPSADNFMGLMYSFLGKGEVGDKQKDFFESKLNGPYKRGVAAIDSAKQKISNEYKSIKKKNFGFVDQLKLDSKLNKQVPKTTFNYDSALRVYMWNKAGVSNSDLDLTQKEVDALVEAVKGDPKLLSFANDLSKMSSLEGKYPNPEEFWDAGNISSDINYFIDNNRGEYLKEFIENSDQIFSKENLNKTEATYGSKFREALDGSLESMKSGRLRKPLKKGSLEQNWLDWLNNSTATIMFFNVRSAVLQTISSVNYLNWNDNNPLQAARAFANPKQFWSDFYTIFTSDKLEQRRSGTKINISESEISNAVSGQQGVNTTKSVIQALLRKGFVFTQIADSLAIAFGGASMYRNRINTYIKQGLSKEAAEQKSFEDFDKITEETQQSSDPSEISAQQRSHVGRLILAFANTPMQYARLTKKAFLDLKNRRGDDKTNLSKLFYYVAVQNIIFSGLQTALFATLGFGGNDEDDEKQQELLGRQVNYAVNGIADSILRGSGYVGAIAAALKNAAIEIYKQNNNDSIFSKDFAKIENDLLSVSPPLGSKFGKLYSASKQSLFEKDVIEAKGFDYDSPIYQVRAKQISAGINIPLDRAYQTIKNLSDATNQDYETWQRVLLGLGWSSWDLGLENQEHELIKTDAKDARRKEGYRKSTKTRKKNQKKMQDAKNKKPRGVIKTKGSLKSTKTRVIKTK